MKNSPRIPSDGNLWPRRSVFLPGGPLCRCRLEKPLGSVFLRKLEDGGVQAFNSSCPHAGCSVGFRSGDEVFYCPCHESIFGLDGSRGEVCVSPRGLDSLEVDQEELKKGEVVVTFQNFAAGIEEKKAI